MPNSKRSKKPGVLVSFEGPEGGGKSTQIELLAKRLEGLKRRVVRTREPGGTAIGEAIRDLLQHRADGEGLCAHAELLLFAASRAQLVRQVIVPALEQGAIILSDRFLDSTTIYQGVARSLGHDPVAMINEFAVGDTMPDVTFVLDVPPQASLERVRHRNQGHLDRLERENLDFYRKIREGYLVLARSMPGRFFVVDGLQPVDVVEKLIWDELQRRELA